MRGFATYLLVGLAGIVLFLAIPDGVQASERVVSSIIVHELDEIARESELQSIDLSYTKWPIDAKSYGVPQVSVISDSKAIPAGSDARAELEAYDELRDSRLAQFANAERTKPAEFSALPLFPEPNSRLTASASLCAGMIESVHGFRSGSQTRRPIKPDLLLEILRLRDAAVNSALRDYYSNRNGYHGRLEYANQQPRLSIYSPSFFHTLISVATHRDDFIKTRSGLFGRSTTQTSRLSRREQRGREAVAIDSIHSIGNNV
jgi:hypothetical protein